MTTWTWVIDGVPQGFFKTKKSLLISYDMMPLRGLRKTERVLNRKGRIVKGEFILSLNGPWLIPFKKRHPDIDFMDYSSSGNEYESRFRSLCFYLRDEVNLVVADKNMLVQYYLRSASKDKRIRRPLPRIKNRCDEILESLGYRIEACEFKAASK